jgi:hypothetical protein
MNAAPASLPDALRVRVNLPDFPNQAANIRQMFVRADNRSFQQELAQQGSQEQTPQELAPFAVTNEALSQVPASPAAKRKHSTSSSVATNGSTRSDLADIDLTFSDEPREIDLPTMAHREFATGSPRANKMGDIVESLANCRTNENESPVLGDAKPDPKEGNAPDMRMLDSEASTPKGPEMAERAGGSVPFFHRSSSKGPPQCGPIDLMDMDLDPAYQGG